MAGHYIPLRHRRAKKAPRKSLDAGGGPGEGARGEEELPEETVENSAEMREKFERAMEKAVRKTTAAIRENYEKDLRMGVGREVKKYPGSSSAPFPEQTARMKERMEAAIARAVPKVRAAVQRDFGIEPGPTDVVEDDTVDELDAALTSSKTKSGH